MAGFGRDLSAEERSSAARALAHSLWSGLSSDARRKKTSHAAKSAWKAMTPAERSKEISRRNRVRWKKIPKAERRRWARKWQTKISPTQRSATSTIVATRLSVKQRAGAKKGGRTRRQAKVADLVYVRGLPKLKLLSASETERALVTLAPILHGQVARFRHRSDFTDIEGEAHLGLLTALAKWDKRRDLGALVSDAIRLQLIEYFREAKVARLRFRPKSDPVEPRSRRFPKKRPGIVSGRWRPH